MEIEEIKKQYTEWFNSQVKDSDNWTTLERMCGFDAWLYQQKRIEELEKDVDRITNEKMKERRGQEELCKQVKELKQQLKQREEKLLLDLLEWLSDSNEHNIRKTNK